MTTLKNFSVFLASTVFVFAQLDFNNDNLGQIIFTHVLFRHGERMPLEFYPNDPHKNHSEWKFDVGQLTDEGVWQEYKLGEWLRHHYGQLVSDRYEPSEVFVQSTDVDRTLMSAQSCMTGFYGNWRPEPVHAIPPASDSLLSATATCNCLRYTEEVKRVSTLPEVRQFEDKFKDMYAYVSNHTGSEVKDSAGALKIYDVLAIEESHNMTLPEWTRQIYPEPIKEAGLYSFALPTTTLLQQRLKMGLLIKEMAEHFINKTAGTLSPNRKMWFYSVHDATLSALLNTFKAFEIHFPPYSACVLLELRLIEGKHFVTMFYRNSTTEEPKLMRILNCDLVCPLDQFLSLVQPLLPVDWLKECESSSRQDFVYIWIGATLIVFIVCCMAIFVVFKRKSSMTYYTMSTSKIIDSVITLGETNWEVTNLQQMLVIQKRAIRALTAQGPQDTFLKAFMENKQLC